MITGGALVATIWIAAATIAIPALNRGDLRNASMLRTETIQLSCLSPAQASDIINPYVRHRGSTFYIPSSGIAAITVRGTPDELAKSRDLIREFEQDPSAACRVPGTSLLHPGDATSLLKSGDKFPLGEGPSGSAPVVVPGPVPSPSPKKR
jgi:type II secretory pathway component GspD/PulD (secretin)